MTSESARKERALVGEPISFLLDVQNLETDRCIDWPFSAYKNGYGYLSLNGHRTTIGAHRLCCHLYHGKPKDLGLEAAHSCGNRRCVNPKHLRWATAVENDKDKDTHGTRFPSEKISARSAGEGNPNSKLKEQDVICIRKSGKSSKNLAEEYGITSCAINRIRNRKAWSHVE